MPISYTCHPLKSTVPSPQPLPRIGHPQKGWDLVSCLSMTVTSALIDGWVLDSIACLVNKGLVVHTLAFCILC